MSERAPRERILSHMKNRAGSIRPGYQVHNVSRVLCMTEGEAQGVFDELLAEGLVVVSTSIICTEGHHVAMSKFTAAVSTYEGEPECGEWVRDDDEGPCYADLRAPQHTYSHSDKLRAIWQAEPKPPSPLLAQLCNAAGVDPNGHTWESFTELIRRQFAA